MKKGETVFNFGDFGQLFYMIIKGTVSVHVLTFQDKRFIDDNELEDTKALLRSQHFGAKKRKESDLSEIARKKITWFHPHKNYQGSTVVYRVKMLRNVSEMSEGEAFGEIALMDDKER